MLTVPRGPPCYSERRRCVFFRGVTSVQMLLRGRVLDLRIIVLYRDVVSSVVSKAAQGAMPPDRRASLQSRIIESNLVALNASTYWLPEWMVLRLRYLPQVPVVPT